MNLGIVGHEQAKFTTHTEQLARDAILSLILQYLPDYIVSGRCPLGGVDIYAEQIAHDLSIPTIIHEPKLLRWRGTKYLPGYYDRNLLIARDSDICVCIVLRDYTPTYTGMRFSHCYHCDSHFPRNPTHIKSGGCWTAWKCTKRKWVII